MKNKRFLLNEEEGLDQIELEPIVVEPEMEVQIEEPKPEVVTTAYMDMLQDVLRKQWDVINACDSIVASLSMDESIPFNKEDVSSVLKKIVEDTTVAIGMTTKAISTVDPKQEDLMADGVDKAEEVINNTGEHVEETLTEAETSEKEHKKKIVDLIASETDVFDKDLKLIEYFTKLYSNGELLITHLTKSEIKELKELFSKLDFIEAEGNTSYRGVRNTTEGKQEKIYDYLTTVKFEDKKLNEELAVDLSDLEYYDRYWAEEALYQLEYIMDNIEDYSDYEGWENLSDLPADVLKDICIDVAESVRNSDYLWEQINEIIMDRLTDSIDEHIEEWQRRSVTEIGNENKEGEGE